MYYPNCLEYNNNIEEICYKQNHIDKVWDEIKQIIPQYFKKFTDTESGHSVQESEMEKLAAKFGSSSKPKSKPKDTKIILERLIKESIEDFEKERSS